MSSPETPETESSPETPETESSPETPTETAEAPEAEAPEAEAVDELRQGLLDTLTRELGDGLVASEIRRGDLWVRVRTDAWRQAVEVCRGPLACDYFCFLSGIDWMPATAPNPEEAAAETDVSGLGDDDDEAAAPEEEAEEEAPPSAFETEAGIVPGYAGGDGRFQVFARLYSTSKHYGVTLKADVDEDQPRVESITSVYAGAEWHERETWEMYGFQFEGHPGLRHIYLPSEFEGFPLRKDFPLLAREVKPWPGLVDVEPMPEEQEAPAEPAAPAGGET